MGMGVCRQSRKSSSSPKSNFSLFPFQQTSKKEYDPSLASHQQNSTNQIWHSFSNIVVFHVSFLWWSWDFRGLVDVYSWWHDSRTHAHYRRPACISLKVFIVVVFLSSARSPGDTRMSFVPLLCSHRILMSMSVKFYVLLSVAWSLEWRTCFYFHLSAVS